MGSLFDHEKHAKPDQEVARHEAALARRGRHRGRALTVQARLAVGSADDPLEREADALARDVVASLQRSTGGDAQGASAGIAGLASTHEVVGRIRRRADPAPMGADGGDLDERTARSLQGAIGGGAPLPESAQGPMEQAFGVDFSGVRVHAGGRAAELNRSLSATAFTVGSDVFFRDGVPDTTRAAGQSLLTHELAHVVQQGGAPAVSRVQRREDAPPPATATQPVVDRPGHVDHEAKLMQPGPNPKVDVGDPAAVAQQIRVAERQDVEDKSTEATEAAVKTKATRDALKVKGPDAGVNYRGGALGLPARGVYEVKALVKALPDAAVQKQGAPGPNALSILGDSYGVCDTEAIGDAQVRVTAVRDGNEWHAEAEKIVGPYSKVARLPGGMTEVTGPGGGGAGETTVANSTAQVTNLLATEGPPWYMVKAVDNHESVHEERLLPALRTVASEFQKDFAKLTVPYQSADAAVKAAPAPATGHADKASALTAIKALPAYTALLSSLRDVWDAEYVRRIGEDHKGKAQKGEEKASRPMINKINAFRKKSKKKAIPVKYTWVPY